jgi:hypothetical protein
MTPVQSRSLRKEATTSPFISKPILDDFMNQPNCEPLWAGDIPLLMAPLEPLDLDPGNSNKYDCRAYRLMRICVGLTIFFFIQQIKVIN